MQFILHIFFVYFAYVYIILFMYIFVNVKFRDNVPIKVKLS